MTKFLMETEQVTSVANDVKNLVSTADEIYSAINSWSIDCSDFAFNDAKAAILTNVKGMSKKISNTYDLIMECVDAHTKLQEAISDDGSAEDGANNSGGDTTGNNGGNSSGGASYGGSSYGGGGDGSSGGGSTSDTLDIEEVTSLSAVTGLTLVIPIKDKSVLEDDEEKELLTEVLKSAKKLGVEVKYVLEENLTEEEKKNAYVASDSSEVVKSVSTLIDDVSGKINSYVTTDGAKSDAATKAVEATSEAATTTEGTTEAATTAEGSTEATTTNENSTEVSTGSESGTEAATSLDINEDKKELAGALLVKDGKVVQAIAKNDDTSKFTKELEEMIEKEK